MMGGIRAIEDRNAAVEKISGLAAAFLSNGDFAKALDAADSEIFTTPSSPLLNDFRGHALNPIQELPDRIEHRRKIAERLALYSREYAADDPSQTVDRVSSGHHAHGPRACHPARAEDRPHLKRKIPDERLSRQVKVRWMEHLLKSQVLLQTIALILDTHQRHPNGPMHAAGERREVSGDDDLPGHSETRSRAQTADRATKGVI
jgi:hypothetical protein